MPEGIDPNAAEGEVAAPAEAEGVKEMKAMIEKMQKQFQGQSAALRKSMEAQEALAEQIKELKEKPVEEEKPKGPIAGKLAELDTLKKQFADSEAKANEKLNRSRMTALMRLVEGQIAGAGVKPGLAKMAAETIKARIKDQIVFDDSAGEDVALLKSGEDLMQISDFVAQYLTTDEGKELLPEKDKPKLSGFMGKGSVKSSSAKLRVTQSDLLTGRFKMEDVLAGRVVLSDG